ncbi:cytochrome b5 domain containing 2 [Phyllostomus discolor]|uniref:Cytochrome b5 domain containing 2 n=1 Tax=Phyllostomus discolor TaxID=89673 RepID=A0A834DUE6_9CHIR|nr:cytochrome b5 domain containing 2 [Phyllostomus discolor]
MLTLQNWLSFYEKNYEFVGKVIGRFYGEDGLPTPELTQVEAKISKGLEAKTRALEEKHKFPPCNSEWSSARGSRFWCSPNSSCPLPRLPANSPHLPKNKSLSQAACQLETSSLQKTSVVSCNRSEKPGWRSRLSPSQDFPSIPCLQTRPAQYCSIQQAVGMNWELWWSHKHAELHAGTPFREKSEEAEQGSQK